MRRTSPSVQNTTSERARNENEAGLGPSRLVRTSVETTRCSSSQHHAHRGGARRSRPYASSCQGLLLHVHALTLICPSRYRCDFLHTDVCLFEFVKRGSLRKVVLGGLGGERHAFSWLHLRVLSCSVGMLRCCSASHAPTNKRFSDPLPVSLDTYPSLRHTMRRIGCGERAAGMQEQVCSTSQAHTHLANKLGVGKVGTYREIVGLLCTTRPTSALVRHRLARMQRYRPCLSAR